MPLSKELQKTRLKVLLTVIMPLILLGATVAMFFLLKK
jgi:hypothetical protein